MLLKIIVLRCVNNFLVGLVFVLGDRVSCSTGWLTLKATLQLRSPCAWLQEQNTTPAPNLTPSFKYQDNTKVRVRDGLHCSVSLTRLNGTGEILDIYTKIHDCLHCLWQSDYKYRHLQYECFSLDSDTNFRKVRSTFEILWKKWEYLYLVEFFYKKGSCDYIKFIR